MSTAMNRHATRAGRTPGNIDGDDDMICGPGPQCPRCQATTEVVGGFNAVDYIQCSTCGFYADYWQDQHGTHFEQQEQPHANEKPRDANERDKRLTDEHARNLGWILLRLAEHTPGDFGDSSFNSTLVSHVDLGRPAKDLVDAMCSLPPEGAEECVNSVNTGIPDMRARNRRAPRDLASDEMPLLGRRAPAPAARCGRQLPINTILDGNREHSVPVALLLPRLAGRLRKQRIVVKVWA